MANWCTRSCRAAINFNTVLDKLGIKGYEKVKSGDLAKIIYLHKNKFGIDKIAYLDTMPTEFEEHFQIDYKTTFIKTVFDELKRIYKSVGWPSFNPADNYAFSLFDLMMMEPEKEKPEEILGFLYYRLL